MRSFAFSSIQDQRAELERSRGGEVFPVLLCLSISLSIHPSMLHSPKAKRQTERCSGFPSFNTCTLSSSPPLSSHIWLGFFLVCFCHSLWVFFGLGLFLVSSYKKCDACSPHCSVSLLRLSQCLLPSWSKGSVP